LEGKKEKLKKVLKKFSLEDVEKVEEADRQFRALKELYEEVKNPERFLKLVIINALLSYQLQMKGEEYWEAFSEFFKKGKDIGDFQEFLSVYNRRFLSAKLKRFQKAKRCVEELFREFSVSDLGKNLKLLVDYLSKCMGQKKEAKTVVFAAKMFMYGYRIVFGKYPEGLWEIEIPLDSRLKKVIPTVREWRELSREVNIPPIRLDALVWVPMGNLSPFPEDLKDKLNELKEVLIES